MNIMGRWDYESSSSSTNTIQISFTLPWAITLPIVEISVLKWEWTVRKVFVHLGDFTNSLYGRNESVFNVNVMWMQWVF